MGVCDVNGIVVSLLSCASMRLDLLLVATWNGFYKAVV
jgi:hypothetical protein